MSLSEPACRAKVRSFYISALEPRHHVGYLFRFLPQEFTLEADLKKVLDAFSTIDEDYPESRSTADLKLLRRVAFQRYAFGFAWELNRLLRRRHVSWLWLHKDYLLPRIPLSLAIGYPIVLTLPREWLWVLGNHPAPATAVIVLCCFLAWFLIYNNVRDRIGAVCEAQVRAAKVFFGTLIWSAAFLEAGRKFAELDPGLRQSFHWPTALLISAVALVVAIVAQFFFTKSGSIADPL